MSISVCFISYIKHFTVAYYFHIQTLIKWVEVVSNLRAGFDNKYNLCHAVSKCVILASLLCSWVTLFSAVTFLTSQIAHRLS